MGVNFVVVAVVPFLTCVQHKCIEKKIIIVVSGPFASMGIWNGFEILQCLPAFLPKLYHSLGKNGVRGMLTSIAGVPGEKP